MIKIWYICLPWFEHYTMHTCIKTSQSIPLTCTFYLSIKNIQKVTTPFFSRFQIEVVRGREGRISKLWEVEDDPRWQRAELLEACLCRVWHPFLCHPCLCHPRPGSLWPTDVALFSSRSPCHGFECWKEPQNAVKRTDVLTGGTVACSNDTCCLLCIL
jgi:hypothetical protein